MGKSRIYENPTDCPVTHTLTIIGGRWKPIILSTLMGKRLRFGKLTIFMPTISRKILTEQLKELEATGLILREEFAESPPRVEYSLTKKGETVMPIIIAMAEWGKTEGKDIRVAP
ncbi:MAG: helix-turn-helix domain-containing protein [Dyadobacter sp.]